MDSGRYVIGSFILVEFSSKFKVAAWLLSIPGLGGWTPRPPMEGGVAMVDRNSQGMLGCVCVCVCVCVRACMRTC